MEASSQLAPLLTSSMIPKPSQAQLTGVDAECTGNLEDWRQWKASSLDPERLCFVECDSFEAVMVNESPDNIHFSDQTVRRTRGRAGGLLCPSLPSGRPTALLHGSGAGLAQRSIRSAIFRRS